MQISWLGTRVYTPLWQHMRQHASAIAASNAQEIVYLCEHEPVYVTGRRGIDNVNINTHSILPAPFVIADRGGETTFHGAGQIMLYPIINVRQRAIRIKQYVWLLEESCINLLQQFNINSYRHCGMPGVWIADAKIAALGVRITKGVAYHGMALNISTDLQYFSHINPCGLGKDVCRLQDIIPTTTEIQTTAIAKQWAILFLTLLDNS